MPGVLGVISTQAVVPQLEWHYRSDRLAARSDLRETMLGHSSWLCAFHLEAHDFVEL